MTKGINYAYQELENILVRQINSAGLPLFAVRDLLNRLLLQVDKQMTEQVETEKKAYFEGLKAEQAAAAKKATESASVAASASTATAESTAASASDTQPAAASVTKEAKSHP